MSKLMTLEILKLQFHKIILLLSIVQTLICVIYTSIGGKTTSKYGSYRLHLQTLQLIILAKFSMQ